MRWRILLSFNLPHDSVSCRPEVKFLPHGPQSRDHSFYSFWVLRTWSQAIKGKRRDPTNRYCRYERLNLAIKFPHMLSLLSGQPQRHSLETLLERIFDPQVIVNPPDRPKQASEIFVASAGFRPPCPHLDLS